MKVACPRCGAVGYLTRVKTRNSYYVKGEQRDKWLLTLVAPRPRPKRRGLPDANPLNQQLRQRSQADYRDNPTGMSLQG
jgi:hypothetical protein